MQDMMEFLQQLAPNQARKSWLIIDSIVVLWSVLLLLELFDTLDARLEGERAYLVYNFGTTLVWFVACDFHILDHYYRYYHHKDDSNSDEEESSRHPSQQTEHQQQSAPSEKQQEDIRLLIFEGIIALYFLYDSIDVYKKWHNPDEDVEAEILDTAINAVSYAYQVIRVVTLPKEDYREVPSSPTIDV